MRKHPFIVILAVFLTSAVACDAPRDRDANARLDGRWEGPFMEETGTDFLLAFEFDSMAGLARVMLWQDGAQIQDDPLGDVRVAGDSVRFSIPAKETRFEGILTPDGLKGEFVFPDGSRPVVSVRRAAEPAAEGALDEAALREDIDVLLQAIATRHPHPFAFTDERAFRDGLDAAAAAVPTPAEPADLLRVLAPVVAGLGCAHTVLDPGENPAGRVFPLSVEIIDDRLFVIGEPMVGIEITAIDGIEASEVIARLTAAVPADGNNEAWKRHVVNMDFGRAYATWIAAPDSFLVDLERPDGSSERRTMHAVAAGPPAPPPAPLALRFEADGSVPVLTVESFMGHDPTAWLGQLRELYSRIDETETAGLIVDLRGNTGGFPALGAELLTYLAHEPFTYFAPSEGPVDFPALYRPIAPKPNAWRGRLVVLIDGANVSTAGQVAALVDHLGIGTLVGERTGGGALCHDAPEWITLPHSRLVLRVPSRTFRVVADATSETTVHPDVRVTPTVRDRLDGRDPVLERALEIIGGQPL